jgi:hypothetical protein
MVIDTSQFKNQSVRDLAWAICSPPLISKLQHRCLWPESSWYRHIAEETWPWLISVDTDPDRLDELLTEQKDRRLGKYFETLWFYWLSHHRRYQLVENNIQVIIDGETLGEIDFIVFDRVAKQMIHWELAVKFYLGIGDTRKMSNWHGPHLHDRLDIKVQHLIDRQSLITAEPRVSQWLKQNDLAVDQCAVILKGRLYYPWLKLSPTGQENTLTGVIPPQISTPDHLKSRWLRLSEFTQEFHNDGRFMPLINTGWLEKIPTSREGDCYSKEAIIKMVSNKEMRLPLHLQLCEPRQGWDRVFLVDENWADKIA